MSIMSLLPLLPALIASGKAPEGLGDLADAAPTLAGILDGSQSLEQFAESLPDLHKSGAFKRLGADIYSLWMIADIELGDPAHMASLVAALKSALPPK